MSPTAARFSLRLAAARLLALWGCGNQPSPPADPPPVADAQAPLLSVPDAFFVRTVSDCDGAAAVTVPDAGCAPTVPNVSYARDVAPIFSGCTGELCHGPWTRASVLGIPTTQCCDHRALALPGHPDESYLVQKLEGRGDLCFGSSMPPDVSLPEGLIAIVRSWICEGALDD